MIKYIFDTLSRLSGHKRGIEANAAKWQNQPITVADIDSKINLLERKQSTIEGLKEQLLIVQAEAHTLCDECEEFADRTEALAIGIEGNLPEKLAQYGITLRKTAEKKIAPTKVLIPILEDDTDGIGFIVSTQVDPDALNYEWEKGEGADPSKTDIIPPLKLFKVTNKASFVDDEIPKGVRVFYRVRAVNRGGQGPWSEAVSRVQ